MMEDGGHNLGWAVQRDNYITPFFSLVFLRFASLQFSWSSIQLQDWYPGTLTFLHIYVGWTTLAMLCYVIWLFVKRLSQEAIQRRSQR